MSGDSSGSGPVSRGEPGARPAAADEAAWVGFDWSRERYEDFISRVVPEYAAQESLIAGLVRQSAAGCGDEAFAILELGSGTGGLSRFLLKTFPRAHLTALDVSPRMLAVCRETLAPFGRRARVVEADFAAAELGGGYQAVVSRLALHHLDDSGKEALTRRVYAALAPGGVFVNNDMITGGSEEADAALMAEWRDYMTARGDDPDEWVRWLVGEDDHPATEAAQRGWLEAAGFVQVKTVWKRAGFALFRAIRAC